MPRVGKLSQRAAFLAAYLGAHNVIEFAGSGLDLRGPCGGHHFAGHVDAAAPGGALKVSGDAVDVGWAEFAAGARAADLAHLRPAFCVAGGVTQPTPNSSHIAPN